MLTVSQATQVAEQALADHQAGVAHVWHDVATIGAAIHALRQSKRQAANSLAERTFLASQAYWDAQVQSQRASTCPACGRRMGWDGHAYSPCQGGAL